MMSKVASFSFSIKNNYKVTKQVSLDLKRFCLNENFNHAELKSKYLTLTKMYHPDVRKSDPQATKLFQDLKNSYERLKVFLELKNNSISFDQNINKYGKVVIEEVVQNFHEFYTTDKKEVIKIMCK